MSALLPTPPTDTSQLGPAPGWRSIPAAGLIFHTSPCKQERLILLFSTVAIYSPLQCKRSPSENSHTWTGESTDEIKIGIVLVLRLIFCSVLLFFFIHLLSSPLHSHSLSFLCYVFLLTLPSPLW